MAVAQFVKQVLACRPRGDGVDDGVPEPLERQHKGAHELERHADLVRVDDRVDAVGARRDPGDEDGGEEEDGTLSVRPGRVVELVIATTVRVRRAGSTRRRRQQLLRSRGEAADRLRHRLGRVVAALDGQAHVVRRPRGDDRVGGEVNGVGPVGLIARRPGLRADGGVASKWRGGGGAVGGVDEFARDDDLGGAHRVLRVAVDGEGIGVGGVKVA